MEKIAKFHKVSMQRFEKDWGTAFLGTDAAEIPAMIFLHLRQFP